MSQSITILIADDDPCVHESLALYLQAEGFQHISAFDGKEALELFNAAEPDLIVLDNMMPLKTGSEVCQEIRRVSEIPIIMLTAKSEEIDKISGLELGADDYITKPFSTREVVARIKAVLRRLNERKKEKSSILKYNGLTINPDNYQVHIWDDLVSFTPKEFDILYMLAANPGHVFPREEILQKIWGYERNSESRTLDTHIKKIRQKLSVENAQWALISIYGIGYKFEIGSSTAV